MTNEISEKAKENLRRNEEYRKNDSKYVKLQSGQKIVLHFDPENMKPVEVEFDGKKSTRYQYVVIDPNEKDQQEKYFTVGKR